MQGPLFFQPIDVRFHESFLNVTPGPCGEMIIALNPNIEIMLITKTQCVDLRQVTCYRHTQRVGLRVQWILAWHFAFGLGLRVKGFRIEGVLRV